MRTEKNYAERGSAAVAFLSLGIAAIALYLPWIFCAGLLSVARAQVNGGQSLLTHYVIKSIIGLAALIAVTRVSVRWLERVTPYTLVILGVTSIVTMIRPSSTHHGPYVLPVGYFDSGLMMLLLATIYLASHFSREFESRQPRFFGLQFAAVLALAFLVLLEQRQIEAITVFAIMVLLTIVLFASRPSSSLAPLLAVPSLTAVAVYLASPDRFNRLMRFAHPWADPYSSGYQVSQSLLAIGRGGWGGVGFEMGVAREGFLPEVSVSFLPAHISEELGAWTLLVLILSLLVLFTAAIFVARRSQPTFVSILAVTLTFGFVGQGLCNLAIVTGLFPPMILPFPLGNEPTDWTLVHTMGLGLLLGRFREMYTPSGVSPFSDVFLILRGVWTDNNPQLKRLGRLLAHPAVGAASTAVGLILGLIALIRMLVHFLQHRP